MRIFFCFICLLTFSVFFAYSQDITWNENLSFSANWEITQSLFERVRNGTLRNRINVVSGNSSFSLDENIQAYIVTINYRNLFISASEQMYNTFLQEAEKIFGSVAESSLRDGNYYCNFQVQNADYNFMVCQIMTLNTGNRGWVMVQFFYDKE